MGADPRTDVVRPVPAHRPADVRVLRRRAVRVHRPGLLRSAPARIGRRGSCRRRLAGCLVASVGLAFTNTVPFLLRRPIQYEVAIASGLLLRDGRPVAHGHAVLGPGLGDGAWRGKPVSGTRGGGAGPRWRSAVPCFRRRAVGAAAPHRQLPHRVDRESLTLLGYALAPFVICGLSWRSTTTCALADSRISASALSSLASTRPRPASTAWPTSSRDWPPICCFRRAWCWRSPTPFLRTSASLPITLPSGYAGGSSLAGEPTGGVLTTMPITLLLVAALPPLWIWHRRGERRAVVAATGLALLGLGVVALVSWALFGTTERYEVDFVTLLLIPAFLVWAVLLARAPSPVGCPAAVGSCWRRAHTDRRRHRYSDELHRLLRPVAPRPSRDLRRPRGRDRSGCHCGHDGPRRPADRADRRRFATGDVVQREGQLQRRPRQRLPGQPTAFSERALARQSHDVDLRHRVGRTRRATAFLGAGQACPSTADRGRSRSAATSLSAHLAALGPEPNPLTVAGPG